MGETINVVYAGRLVKLCCNMCVPKFEANPMPTIGKIDAAWMAMHDGKGMEHKEMDDHGSQEGHGKPGHHDG
ncbi:MAG: hypothetical protein JKX70_06495 [Phycisphaerales bacterium]|nr:hypothetical protein [Phycisphaerales bacterium]